jgi:hypothetical protein
MAGPGQRPTKTRTRVAKAEHPVADSAGGVKVDGLRAAAAADGAATDHRGFRPGNQGRAIERAYATLAYVQAIINPAGNRWTISYNSDNLPTAVY